MSCANVIISIVYFNKLEVIILDWNIIILVLKDAKNMINASKTQGKMMNLFNERLQNFKFNCIGENLTDDEKRIGISLPYLFIFNFKITVS